MPRCTWSGIVLLALFTAIGWEPAAVHAENYAFLVAVQDYNVKSLRPLKFTRNDIQEFSKALQASGFKPEHIVLMTDKPEQIRYAAEAEKIRTEFDLLLSGIKEGDSLVVAFAGHGVQFEGEAKNYYCPLDVNLEDRQRTRLVALSEIYEKLKECPAKRKLLIVDACRKDPQTELSRSRETVKLRSVTRPQAEVVPKGLVAVFSCSAGQEAFEWPEYKHGVFFHHLLEGWNGAARGEGDDRTITLDRVITYATDKTQVFTRLTLQASQVPHVKSDFEGTWVLRKLESSPASATGPMVTLEKRNTSVDVKIGGRLFTTYHFDKAQAKPYFHPVLAKDGTSIVRGLEGVVDFPHHKGIWFGINGVNGINFWNDTGSIQNVSIEIIDSGKNPARLRTVNHWMGSGTPLLTETAEITIHADRLMQFDFRLNAVAARVTFADNREGLFGIRIAPSMRESQQGQVVNADGIRGTKSCWGLPSKWVDYSGAVNGSTYGVAIFDNPSNFRPSRFHCRDYGLLAINPFGQRSYSDGRFPADPFILERGKSARLQYGLYVHDGNQEQGGVADAYQRYRSATSEASPRIRPVATHDAVIPQPRESNPWMKRHASMNEVVKKGNVDLIFIGDSAAQGWEGAGKAAWDKFYGKRNAVNLGMSGDRTQNVLWRLDHGNIDGIKPKLAVVLIGMNNAFSSTSEQIADGITAIVNKLREKLPETKILVLGIFPFGTDANDARRKASVGANAIVARLADGKMVEYLDIGSKFLDDKAVLSKEIMPDLMHLSPVGYKIWAESIESHVARMMGETKSTDFRR